MEEALSDLLVNLEPWCRFIIVIVLFHIALTPFTVLLCEILGKEEIFICIIWDLKSRAAVLHFCSQFTHLISVVKLTVECYYFKFRQPFRIMGYMKVTELVCTRPGKFN